MKQPNKRTDEAAGGLVYSTNPALSLQEILPPLETAPADKQPLRLQYERAGRGGKEVTLIRGFVGRESDLKALAKQLKSQLGCGGSCKEGEIVLQGDRRESALKLLHQLGYTQTR